MHKKLFFFFTSITGKPVSLYSCVLGCVSVVFMLSHFADWAQVLNSTVRNEVCDLLSVFFLFPCATFSSSKGVCLITITITIITVVTTVI